MNKNEIFDVIDNVFIDCQLDIEDAESIGEINDEQGEEERQLLNWYIVKLKDAISDELIGDEQ